MRAAGLTAAAVLLLAASPAVARMHAGPSQLHAGHRLQGTIAPLDGGGSFGGVAAAYSFRKLKSTYTGPAMRIQRFPDTTTLQVGFVGFVPGLGSPFDTAAATAFCTAGGVTGCIVETWYDQSGNGRDAIRSGGVPSLVLNCLGGQPCARSTDNPQYMVTAASAFAAKLGLSVVAQRASGAGYCSPVNKNASYLQSNATANTWLLTDTGSSTSFTFPATDATWHAIVGNVDGASSVARVDRTETTGTVTGTAGSGPIVVAQGAFAATSECNLVEAIVWDNYALTPAERIALTANQKSFWGTP